MNPRDFVADLAAVAGRALRVTAREPEVVVPALLVPAFLFLMMVAALSDFAEAAGVPDYKAFQLPVAVIFAVTGVSRASSLVLDIQGGYFDRMLLTPVNRLALLLGLMVADVFIVAALAVPCIGLAVALGVDFATGVAGILVFLFVAGAWAVAFNGFSYAIALKTGNPAAVSSAYLLFFPFTFLSTTLAPEDALADWLATAADYNPVTYLLAGLRSVVHGWDGEALGEAAGSIVAVGAVAIALALLALQGRARRP